MKSDMLKYHRPTRRCGGIGRRPGLKIPWEENPVPVQARSPAPEKSSCESNCFFQLSLPFRASEVTLCVVKLLRSEVSPAAKWANLTSLCA